MLIKQAFVKQKNTTDLNKKWLSKDSHFACLELVSYFFFGVFRAVVLRLGFGFTTAASTAIFERRSAG